MAIGDGKRLRPFRTRFHLSDVPFCTRHSGVKDIAAPPIFSAPQAAPRKSVPPLAAQRPRSAVPDPSRATVRTPFVRNEKETPMTKHQITEDQKLAHQQANWLETLRGSFDAEVHLPTDISREFLSAALDWAIANKVDFGLFHEAGKIILRISAVMKSTSRIGGPIGDGTSVSRTKCLSTRAIELQTRGGFPPLVFACRASRSLRGRFPPPFPHPHPLSLFSA